MAGKPQRSRSSKLTGGEGFTYEDLVAAYYLAALLREEQAMGFANGAVVRVAVQQDRQGEPMDDLIVDAEAGGQRSRLSLQVKSEVTISESDTDFQAIIAGALATRNGIDFRVGVDRYGFVTEAVGQARLDSLLNIVKRAKASTSGREFVSRFAPVGESSKSDIALRDELRRLVKPASDDEEWDFWRHFEAFRFDNIAPGGDRYADLANRLGEISTLGGAPFVEILARHVRAGEGSARVWDRNAIVSEMRALAGLRTAPSYAHDLKILDDLAQAALADIRDDIASVTLERKELVEAAENATARHAFTNISGLPGCGKSVVLKRVVERARANGPVLFLKSDRLEGVSWRSFANHHGLQHQSPHLLLGEIGGAGTPTLFIDGIDRIKPGQRGIVTDLLHAIENDANLSHWRVLVTSRDQGLEVLRSWLPASLYSERGVGTVDVGPLGDEEAEELATKHPALAPLLEGTAAVREIARRPFFAAVLADQAASLGFDKQPPPQTEGELIDAWWRAGGYNTEPDEADGRQRAMLDLAERGARSLGKDIRGRELAAETIKQLPGLRKDKIVEAVEAGSSYKFTHDIFFEWAFFRLLIDKREDWTDALVAAGEPPLLARIVGLLAQHSYDQGSGWDTGFAALNSKPLRPQWRRAWLLAPAASTRFAQHRAQFESLLNSNAQALLEKFLVWFQAERTVPSPILLQTPNPGVGNSMLIRVADLMGWPSDSPAWQRVLVWIFVRHDTFSARALPHAVELFQVWQNMGADFANPISKRIIETSEAWLLELEAGGGERWKDLPGDTRGSLAGDLRKIILRAARAYPDAAGRALDRVAKMERRRDGVLKDVFGFSVVLAQAHPEKLADLVRSEVLRELPKDEAERKERERTEHYAHLKAIREKPESQRTDIEKRVLASPSFFHAMGHDTYDFDDIGVDRGHTLFYPPAPAHEPFDALFQHAPDTARGLVRDIANHATTGWRQIHEINRGRYGTPLQVEVDFPWGKQTVWGSQRTYAWYFGEGGPQPLEAAYLALTHWAHKQLEGGAALDDLIRQVTEGHEDLAALGLAASLAIEKGERSAATWALLASQRLWATDLVRQVQEGGREVNFFGFDPKGQMTDKQRAADAYLKARPYRQSSLKDLSYLYALSVDEKDREAFKALVAGFATALPYEHQEQVGHGPSEEEMRRRAESWADFADKGNYGFAKVEGQEGLSQLVYQAPPPTSPERKAELEENSNSLGDFNLVGWATGSLKEGKVDARLTMDRVVEFAKSRDHETLLNKIDEAGIGIRQAGVVACAAMVLRFEASGAHAEWAWSVIDRVEGVKENDGVFRYSNNPVDPRTFAMVALKADIAGASPRPTSAERLLSYAADPNPNISETAFAGLFDASTMPAELVWNAGGLATELFASHFPAVTDDREEEGEKAKQHRAEALARALARLHQPDSAGVLVAPPPAWVKVETKRRRKVRVDDGEVEWTYPTFDFNAQFAAKIAIRFPVEKWCEVSESRDAFIAYVEALVAWTADRLFPSFAGEDDERSSQLYEWLSALAGLVARVMPHVPIEQARPKLIDPLASHSRRDVMSYVDDLTDQLTRRYVYDAATLPDSILQILDLLMTRMLSEPEFSSTGYRPGNIRDGHLNSMLRSFLLVSAKDCPGAARFANGVWSDLPRMMPLISRLMAAAGWADGVMDKFLTLCERAGADIAIEDFTQIVTEAMDAEGFRLERWNAAGIPAGISGVIQGLADANYPLTPQRARALLIILDHLVDIGDRRAAALQQSEHFRGIQIIALPAKAE